MKIRKFNESMSAAEERLESDIYDIIRSEVGIERVIYSDDYGISSESVDNAAKEIVKYLINEMTQEILNELILKRDSKKYNL